MRSGKFLIQLKFMRRIVRQQRLIRQFLRIGGALLRSSRGFLNNGGYLLNSIYNLSNCSGLFLRRLIPLLILAVAFSAIAFFTYQSYNLSNAWSPPQRHSMPSYWSERNVYNRVKNFAHLCGQTGDFLHWMVRDFQQIIPTRFSLLCF